MILPVFFWGHTHKYHTSVYRYDSNWTVFQAQKCSFWRTRFRHAWVWASVWVCPCVGQFSGHTPQPHSTATHQPRDVNMLWASVSVSVSNFGSKEGGTLNLLLTLFRRKGLDCRSLWAFDKLQLMSSWMSFSDFDCADNILWWRERGKIHWLRKEELKQTVDSGDFPASQINIKLQW